MGHNKATLLQEPRLTRRHISTKRKPVQLFELAHSLVYAVLYTRTIVGLSAQQPPNCPKLPLPSPAFQRPKLDSFSLQLIQDVDVLLLFPLLLLRRRGKIVEVLASESLL